jgi:carbon starvation protein CstA
MFYFFVCLAALVLGYMTYGAVVDRILAPDEKAVTPAYSMRDDVDHVPMPKWKLLLIQVLDIAGIGPIFGPILGALYGPAALLWIVIGSIFAGAVHDYMSGMLSVRNKGASIPELVGEYMGMPARQVMRVFSVILLMLVGVVFVLAPAKLLTGLTGVATPIFVAAIFAYYFLATILPIDKVIGRFYPALGGLLLVMTVSIAIALMASDHPILPNMDFFTNVHPKNLPLWPLLFVTLSCGAISGFHSTQSPLMARCVKNEREGRMVLYGAMIIEGVIALVWATIGLSFYDSSAALGAVVAAGSPAAVVKEASNVLLGPVGGALAVLAVIILPSPRATRPSAPRASSWPRPSRSTRPRPPSGGSSPCPCSSSASSSPSRPSSPSGVTSASPTRCCPCSCCGPAPCIWPRPGASTGSAPSRRPS